MYKTNFYLRLSFIVILVQYAAQMNSSPIGPQVHPGMSPLPGYFFAEIILLVTLVDLIMHLFHYLKFLLSNRINTVNYYRSS